MNDGGLAFPQTIDSMRYGNGMTLRDYFAGMALQGFCANTKLDVGTWIGDAVAKDAYSYADEMIAERDKEAR